MSDYAMLSIIEKAKEKYVVNLKYIEHLCANYKTEALNQNPNSKNLEALKTKIISELAGNLKCYKKLCRIAETSSPEIQYNSLNTYLHEFDILKSYVNSVDLDLFDKVLAEVFSNV